MVEREERDGARTVTDGAVTLSSLQGTGGSVV